jgi:hypothetical protein
MNKKDIDQQLSVMLELAKKLSEAPIAVVKYRSEMIVGLLQELMDTVVDQAEENP